MPKKKLEPIEAPKISSFEEVAIEPEGVSDAQKGQTATAPVKTYYVWNEKSEFVKAFDESEHRGEAKKQAEAFASAHEDWTVTP
jgi:hypothetical protein